VQQRDRAIEPRPDLRAARRGEVNTPEILRGVLGMCMLLRPQDMYGKYEKNCRGG